MKKWLLRQFVRVVHLAVSLTVMLPLLLHPSALHRMVFTQTNLIHGILYLVCFTTTLVAYMIASCTDPGYLTHEKAKLFRHRRGQLSDCGDDEDAFNSTFITDGTHTTGRMETDTHIQSAKPIPDRKSELDVRVKTAKDFPKYFRKFFNLQCCLSCSLFGWFASTFFPTTDNEDYVLNLSVPIRFCKHCLLEQPLRCRHCPDCNRCVIKFDHHCPWLANCVGERNHSTFVAFLMLQTLILWWTLYLSWASIAPNYSWGEWFRVNAIFIVEIVVLTGIGIPLTILLGFHTYLALASKTTWETMAYDKITYLQHLDAHSNPFNQGLARNCLAFCCSRYPFGWDRIYADAVGQLKFEHPTSIGVNDSTSFPDKQRVQSVEETDDAAGSSYVRLQYEPVNAPLHPNQSTENFNESDEIVPVSSDSISRSHDMLPGACSNVCTVNRVGVISDVHT